ncbi:hypothetical protein FGRMN_6892 [Fusarium graminum]|nr:hypothetical protein FGRMN_6892 [Fusarium graminum]
MSSSNSQPLSFMHLLVLFIFFFDYTDANVRMRAATDDCPTTINVSGPGYAESRTMKTAHNTLKSCSSVTELRIHMGAAGCLPTRTIYNLPFALDGSDKYLSSPQVLELQGYALDFSEWNLITPMRPHWSDEDGSWPTPSGPGPLMRWASDRYYRGLMLLDWAKSQFDFRLSRWFMDGKADAWYKWRHVSKDQRSKDNLELWLDAMDFSEIHTLAIRESRNINSKPKGWALFYQLPSRLLRLKSLSIGGQWGYEQVVNDRRSDHEWMLPGMVDSKRPKALDFILAFPASSFTTFAWTDSGTCDDDILEDVLQRYGASLEHLEWTSAELNYDPRPIFTLGQLQKIGEYAPHLRELTIDLDREDNNWSYEKLKTLAQNLPHLASLAVYLNLEGKQRHNDSSIPVNPGVDSIINPAYPILTEDAAEKMFNVFRHAQDTRALNTLIFKEGDWRIPDHGPVIDIPEIKDWKTYVRASVTCRMLEPSDAGLEREPKCELKDTGFGWRKRALQREPVF